MISSFSSFFLVRSRVLADNLDLFFSVVSVVRELVDLAEGVLCFGLRLGFNNLGYVGVLLNPLSEQLLFGNIHVTQFLGWGNMTMSLAMRVFQDSFEEDYDGNGID